MAKWFSKLESRLVDDWRSAHKWLSTQLCALAMSASLAYEYLPAFREFVAPYVSPTVMAILSGLIIMARIWRQSKPKV